MLRVKAEETLIHACEYLEYRAFQQLHNADQSDDQMGDWDAYATIKQRLDEMMEYDEEGGWGC